VTAVFQALRFELDPTNVARSALASHAGASRFAFNWGRALVKSRLDESQRVREQALVGGASRREAEALAGTVPVPWSLAELGKEWNRAKHTAAPWWAANSKEAYNSGLDALARALDGWSKSRRGKRKGRKVGFPRRKKLGARRSFRVTTGSFGVIDGRHVRLPRIGVTRTKEPTTKLAGPSTPGPPGSCRRQCRRALAAGM
jgi:putative transposase